MSIYADIINLLTQDEKTDVSDGVRTVRIKIYALRHVFIQFMNK